MWAAAEVNHGWESVLMWEQRASSWYLELNPKATVPTLRDNQLIINESNSAVAYLLQQYAQPGSNHYPTDPAQLAMAWQWAEWGETTLAPTQNNVFFPVVRSLYSPAAGKQGCPPDEQIAKSVPKLASAWTTLEAHLTGRSYILGEHFGLADFTAAVQASRWALLSVYTHVALCTRTVLAHT